MIVDITLYEPLTNLQGIYSMRCDDQESVDTLRDLWTKSTFANHQNRRYFLYSALGINATNGTTNTDYVIILKAQIRDTGEQLNWADQKVA